VTSLRIIKKEFYKLEEHELAPKVTLQSVQLTFNTLKKFKTPQADRRRWSPLIYWHTTSLSFIMTTSRK